MTRPSDLRREVRSIAQLALPLVIGELGWMGMSIVDTMMVGRVSKEALGGVSLGSMLFYVLGVMAMGLFFSLDTLVSQAFGGRRLDECHRWFVQSLYLAAVVGPLMMVVQLGWIPLIGYAGIHPDVVREAVPYLKAILWSSLPLLIYTAARRYLQSMDLVGPVMFSLVSANLVNAAANWMLIFGHWGFPAMGAAGAGWATVVSRVYMAGILVAYICWRERREPDGLFTVPAAPDWHRLRALLQLGGPASLQLLIEVGLWGLAAGLIAKLDPASLAAHQIALNGAGLAYMMPLGISSAAAVRVGQALGAGNPAAAARAGWTAIGLGIGCMSLSGLAFILFPHQIARAFTTDASVIESARSLLFAAAVFQLFDGAQGVATGALRGAGDTRTPALTHFCGYWLLGLPAGYWLCFRSGWGALGMWTGLCVALMAIGTVLLVAWMRRTRLAAGREAIAASQ